MPRMADQLLTAEDVMYAKAFQEQAIPDKETILLKCLPGQSSFYSSSKHTRVIANYDTN